MDGSSFGRRFHGVLGAVAAVAATGVVLAGPAAGSSAALEVDTTPATPEVRMRAFDPADFADRAAELPAGLTEAIRRDLGQSPEEYLATAAAARLAGEVVGSLGDVVRSAWLDGQTLHVAVRDRGAAIAARGTGAEVQVGDVLTDALSAARTQNKLAYIDRAAERVVAVGAEVRGAPVGQVRLSARSADHAGGSGVAVRTPLADYHCSTAFAGTDADGEPRLLTAGHCGAGADGLFTSGVDELAPDVPLSTTEPFEWPGLIGDELGAYIPESVTFGDGHDAALISVDGDVRPEVSGWSPGAGEEPALTVHDSVAAVAGAPVCAAGVASGWTCGHVLDTRTTVPVSGRPVTGFLFDACVLPGDSGGAVTVGTYALGLSSGSTWPGPSCADGDPASRGDDLSVGYAMPDVEGLYGTGWELAVRVGAPRVTSPADDATTGPTPTITGTADAAAGAVVTVRIEDGPELEAQVGAAGRWSAPVGTALEPGTYTYTARTSLRPATGDQAVTSAETSGEFEVAELAGLGVSWPAAGHVSPDGRLAFEGTGQPGAAVSLTVRGEELASTTVGEDGTWSLRAESARPAGRFDAVLTQHLPAAAVPDEGAAGTASAEPGSGTAESGHGHSADAADASVTVAGVGVAPSAPVVSAPLGRIPATDAGTLTGAGAPGAAVSVRVADAGADVAAAPELRAEAGPDGAWTVQLDTPLPAGRHVVVATQSVDDLTSEPSSPVVVDVAATARAAGGLDGAAAASSSADDGGLPGGALAAAAGILVAGAAVAGALVWRRRRAAG
ncbi:S1 family peptidase [Jiangella endophytica]|uniref:S1 family peptidase n=1 Tax=Jiangella endophytica TaxID=1623398 RepID=UPI000E3443B6|nr:S1 family peptidase [Jiangella endophytica]